MKNDIHNIQKMRKVNGCWERVRDGERWKILENKIYISFPSIVHVEIFNKNHFFYPFSFMLVKCQTGKVNFKNFKGEISIF